MAVKSYRVLISGQLIQATNVANHMSVSRVPVRATLLR